MTGQPGIAVTGGGGSAGDPYGFGEITTYPWSGNISSGTPTANRAYISRTVGAGPITKIGYFTTVQSGNVDVGVYAGGRNYAAPGVRRGSAGSVVMPVAGYTETALTASTNVALGDYLAWICDNGVARVNIFTGGGQAGEITQGGRDYIGGGTFPLPDPSGANLGNAGHGVVLRGIA